MSINVSLLVPSDTGYLFARDFLCGLPSRNGMLTVAAKNRVIAHMKKEGYLIANWWEPRFGNHYIVSDPANWDLLATHNDYVANKTFP
jgi:hypothetical protein